jgi:hypothetical protein
MTETEIINTAKTLRYRKWNWQNISDHLRVDVAWLRAACAPERRDRSRLRNGSVARADRDAMRLMAQIPSDTRDFTARIMGDPLPGRSALDQREAEA